MAGEQEGAARKAPEGIAVSSGDSSAPTPRPALNSERDVFPGVDPADITYAGTAPLPRVDKLASSGEPKSDPSDAATIVTPASPSSGSPPHPIFSHIGATIFHEGDVIGGRYEIRKMLGMGGMGAVYKARDMEVERVVGLKVIRPDLAGNPAILARFKQELVLARQVTHKNIIRIYDLNEADGVKFITMEFIEGEDLRSILTRQGKLSPEEAVGIMVQVCTGLQAAHAEGVIHRDLKPSNIMLDASGRVVIMDFGLARTIQGDGMTQTGMMIGTMEYMSPEQAMGKELDARSDLFALGLIFYELLSGFIPFRAESAIASLVKRTQERAVPLSDVDAAVPPALSEIVSKCLEREPDTRFASVQELIDELEVWQGKKSRSGQSVMSRTAVRPAVAARKPFTKWIAVGVAAVLLVVGIGVGIRQRMRAAGDEAAAVQGPVTSLAIVPFYNASGDSSLNWIGSTIAETLNSSIGQSRHLRMVSPDRLQQVLIDLRLSPQSQLDLQTIKHIAEYTHADTVVFGQYEKTGEQIRINATVADLTNDRNTPINVVVSSDKDLIASLDNLAGNVRTTLVSAQDSLKDLSAHSQRLTTQSVSALRAYDEGLVLRRAGNNTQAVTKFDEATREDPNFAMAFSQLAKTYAALGYDDKAYSASRQAMTLSDNNNLSPRDRFIVQATHASIMHDTAKAIAAYQEVAKLSPDDTEVQFDIAKLYESANNYEEAKKYLSKVLASDPNDMEALLASARVAMNSGDPRSALDPLDKARKLAILVDNESEKGNVYQAQGGAYLDLNSLPDALSSFQRALEIRRSIGDQRGIATTLGQIARVQDQMGKPKEALASYQEAVDIDRKIGDKSGLTKNLLNLGSLYLDHGKYEEGFRYSNEALQLAIETRDEVDQANLLESLGKAHFSKSEYQEALTYFQQEYDIASRLQLQDVVGSSLHNLGFTNFSLGQYDKAESQYMKALETYHATSNKSRIATTSSDMGALFALQGRYDSALKAQQDAVNSYRQLNDRTYLMVWALAGYGDTLSAVGREAEGQRYIEEALKLAPEANATDATVAALNYLGNSYFYSGAYNDAKTQYAKALQTATKEKLSNAILQTKLNLARLDVTQGRSKEAVSTLKKLKQDADTMGLKAEAAQASVYLGEALLESGHPDAARDELDNAIARAEKLGMLVQQARAQYFLGKALAGSGNGTEAVPHYREAVKILQAISKEEGAAQVLERSDLKDLYRDALKSYQGTG
ncbi:MAG: tetratricopeptide repeat protein [Candidatus Korobacteraceae bacterium]